MKKLDPTGLKRLHRSWNRKTENRIAILMDGVQTPWNVGAIVRQAAAFRAHDMFLTGAATPVSHPKARKTSMGTDKYLNVREFDSLAAAADAISDEGYTLLGIELVEDAAPIFDLELGPDVCIALGNEEHGLSPACIARCDLIAYVPLVGKVGSLNVATAAGIAMYELRRREWHP